MEKEKYITCTFTMERKDKVVLDWLHQHQHTPRSAILRRLIWEEARRLKMHAVQEAGNGQAQTTN